MYVQFSEPMKTVGNLKNISLKDENGQVVPGAIFNNVYELWSEDQTQLTLIFDPARVKTGLQAHESMGRALQAGHTYLLYLANLETVTHIKIAPFSKVFHVTDADTIPPNLSKWKLEAPHASSTLALRLSFSDIIDQMSLRQRLIVVNEMEEPVQGSIAIGNHESAWHFTPDTPWHSGKYVIYVNARLADPAGNNLNGLFDHAVGSLNYTSEAEVLRIPFEIQP